ncbi:hypothetical protein B0T22DRAFT_215678 [Podospora appendiculata]|uniref:Zn(2)-C6 fungal-type domain-containing protein n=1 Tax=Podospora appendiculata TaxID=314037 RepID=A0AAE0X5L4_9PEZI|nr:hypothetical protein B0T22DRAFT_215678 [Podospora appendiculata]
MKSRLLVTRDLPSSLAVEVPPRHIMEAKYNTLSTIYHVEPAQGSSADADTRQTKRQCTREHGPSTGTIRMSHPSPQLDQASLLQGAATLGQVLFQAAEAVGQSVAHGTWQDPGQSDEPFFGGNSNVQHLSTSIESVPYQQTYRPSANAGIGNETIGTYPEPVSLSQAPFPGSALASESASNFVAFQTPVVGFNVTFDSPFDPLSWVTTSPLSSHEDDAQITHSAIYPSQPPQLAVNSPLAPSVSPTDSAFSSWLEYQDQTVWTYDQLGAESVFIGDENSPSSPTYLAAASAQLQQSALSYPLANVIPLSFPLLPPEGSHIPDTSSLTSASHKTTVVESRPTSGLEPWINVVKPHEGRQSTEHEPSGLSDCDEQAVVPVSTPSNDSIEEIGQEQAENGVGSTATVSSPDPADHAGDDVRKRRKRGRGRFNEDNRKETSVTRSMGACLRCNTQRDRCKPNPYEPFNPSEPCATCLEFSKISKKTIHNVPCHRERLISITTFRAGELNLTTRFTHRQVKNVGDFADSRIHIIEMTQGLCKTPVILRVRRFRQAPGDVLHRKYIDRFGKSREHQLAPFCLADIEKTAKEFKQYIEENALSGLAEAAKDSDEIVRGTFSMIARQCCPVVDEALQTESSGESSSARTGQQRREFLIKTVILWFAIRHGTGSSWICGSDKLGMKPVSDPYYPLRGRVSIPRMIIAQFDSIRHERIYKNATPKLLKTFESLFKSSDMGAWFTLYMATFLFLHQVSCISFDRYRWVWQNSGGAPQETRYGPIDSPLTKYVEDVQRSAVTLLIYWRYYYRCDLTSIDWKNTSNSPLKYLSSEQLQSLRVTTEHVKRSMWKIPTTPERGCWEHELFWTSRMFEAPPTEGTWAPPETFSTTTPSIGREG